MSRMTLEERVRRAVQKDIAIVSYDPRWPQLFDAEIYILTLTLTLEERKIRLTGSVPP